MTRHTSRATIKALRTPASYDADAKDAFHRAAHTLLRTVAARLGYTAHEYDLRHNRAGIAVSGEIVLHTDDLYIQISQSSLSPDLGILYRSSTGRRDYSGGRNHWLGWGDLRDLDLCVEHFRSLIPPARWREALPDPKPERVRKPEAIIGAFATPRDALIAKLAPSRIADKCNFGFPSLLGALLDWNGPKAHLITTSDNFLLTNMGQDFVGSLDELRRNCQRICAAVGDVSSTEEAYLLAQVDRLAYRRQEAHA